VKYDSVGIVAAAAAAGGGGGGCREEVVVSLRSWVYDSLGPARPLGYPRETPTRGEPADPTTPGPPSEGRIPAGEDWAGADTGSAGSVDVDPGSPAAATLIFPQMYPERKKSQQWGRYLLALHHFPLQPEYHAYAPLNVYSEKP